MSSEALQGLTKTRKELIGKIASSYPILWVDTVEYARAINEFTKAASVALPNREFFKWDVVSGITSALADEDDHFEVIDEESKDDPMAVIEFMAGDKGKDKKVQSGDKIMFVQDFHKWIDNVQIWRSLLNLLPHLKESGNTIVIVSPVVTLPSEIARYVSVMDFDLPTKEEIGMALDKILISNELPILPDEERQAIINSGVGLTSFEFENAVYLCLATNKKVISPEIIHKQKEQLIRQNSTLTVGNYPDFSFDKIIGMDRVKDFVKKMHKKGGRGVLLLGVPGAGKSAFAKAASNETGRLPIELDFGNLQNKYVGETERITREALKVIDNMEPALLFIDEIEKGLAGVSGQSGDSGTSQRQGGQFLKWLQDHETDVYVIATSNDISKLPPEYVRAERWDAIFFIDLPSEEEKEQLLNLYASNYGIDLNANEDMPDITNWTGAEIKSLCKLAANMEVSLNEASIYVNPICKTMEEKIERLREWADGRAVHASSSAEKQRKNGGKKAIARKSADRGKRKIDEL